MKYSFTVMAVCVAVSGVTFGVTEDIPLLGYMLVVSAISGFMAL